MLKCRIAIGHGFVVNDEQLLHTCFATIDDDMGNQVDEINVDGDVDDFDATEASRMDTLITNNHQAEDNGCSAPNGNQETTQENHTNSLITPSHQSLEVYANDDLNIECVAQQKSCLPMSIETEDCVPDEYLINQDPEPTNANIAREEIPEDPSECESNSDSEFRGWDQVLPNHVAANDDLDVIDLTLDDDDFGQNISNAYQYFAIDADQPMKNKQDRRWTFAGIRNKKGQLKQQKCNLCHFSTVDKHKFARHIRTHHTNKKKVFKCKTCAKRYVQFRYFVKHMKIHNQGKLTSFKCSNCHTDLPSDKARKSHEYKCKKGLRQYECMFCHKYVHNKHHLLSHLRMHTGKTDDCPICKKELASGDALTRQMKRHAELFPFKCSNCRQVFSRRSNWKTHQSRCKLKQYKCNICKRDFTNKYHLDYHMKNHTCSK